MKTLKTFEMQKMSSCELRKHFCPQTCRHLCSDIRTFCFFILSWPVIASCCVSGLQRCEQCLGSRPGVSEAASQQTHREHGVSQLAGNRLQLAPPKDHCTLLHSSLYVAVVSCWISEVFSADWGLHLSRSGATGGLWRPPMDHHVVCPGRCPAAGSHLSAALEGNPGVNIQKWCSR